MAQLRRGRTERGRRTRRLPGQGRAAAAQTISTITDKVLAELVELAPLIDKLVAAGVTMTEPGW
ncbi:hypothetical protein, partial [Streptosporangium sp. G12]